MTDEEKWKAVIENNGESDGKFFYAVRTTKIFCRPSCKSKAPLRANVNFFDSKQKALDAGYRPCKRCRPDLIEFSPSERLTTKAKDIIDIYFSDADELEKHIQKLGVSKSYLNKLFLQAYDKTIAEYLRSVRIRRAAAMLLDGVKVTECAFACGFESISAFYSNFKKETGCSPKNYYRNSFNN
jgi:AraC family transcriptional regulator of adaptative response / methylphosphotriester-DNA alkyltransferase methyltransferase